MAYQIQPLIENRVILVVMIGEVAIAEIVHIQSEMLRYLEQSVHPVHMVVDVSQFTKPPTNIRELTKVNTHLSHANMGWVIMVNATPFTSFLLAIVGGVAGVKNKRVNTLEEAITMLRTIDITLAR